MTLGKPRPAPALPHGSCVALGRLLSLSGPASSSVSGFPGSAGGLISDETGKEVGSPRTALLPPLRVGAGTWKLVERGGASISKAANP